MISGVLVDGGDQIAANLALLLVPIGLLDSRKWHWSAPPPEGHSRLSSGLSAVALVAVRFQVAWIYMEASLGKLKVPEWRDGTAIYYWFSHPMFGVPNWLSPLEPLLGLGWVVAFVTWGVLVLEFFLAIAIVLPRSYRRVLYGVGLAFHLSIGLLIGLWSFALVMMSALTLYLGPARHLGLARSLRDWAVSVRAGARRALRSGSAAVPR